MCAAADSSETVGMDSEADFARALSDRLDTAAKRAGLSSDEEIARKAGMDRSTITKYRNGSFGSQGPTLFKLMRLANAVGCDVAYLVGETESLKVAHGPARVDGDELAQCIVTVLKRHNNEAPERLAARVAFLYQRRMSIAQGSLDLLQIIDDSFPGEEASP